MVLSQYLLGLHDPFQLPGAPLSCLMVAIYSKEAPLPPVLVLSGSVFNLWTGLIQTSEVWSFQAPKQI